MNGLIPEQSETLVNYPVLNFCSQARYTLLGEKNPEKPRSFPGPLGVKVTSILVLQLFWAGKFTAEPIEQ